MTKQVIYLNDKISYGDFEMYVCSVNFLKKFNYKLLVSLFFGYIKI